ncbi:MAG: DUF5067 domain-containing protein [Clostridia bacterium]|nr:DUF5067 domain-containing protein [Clostridia bacterium]
MKKYVSTVLPVIALSLAMCLCGCGSIAELLENAESSAPVIDPVESDPVNVPVATDPLLEGKDVSEDGVLGSWTVALAGADRVDFSDGKSALIVFYDFTNNSEQSISSFLALGFSAYQSGKALFSANTFDSYSYQHNSSLRVRPGTTIRCSALYEYDADAGDIEVQIFDWTGNSNVVVCGIYDAVSLPGEDGSFESFSVTSPTWTDGLSNQGIIDGCMIAISSEHTDLTDWNGNSCVRLSISFENSSAETKNFSNDFHTYAYQDGIELLTSAASDSIPEDSNAWADIQPGGIVTITLVYQLRSTDPVELEIVGQDGTKIGAEFSIG